MAPKLAQSMVDTPSQYLPIFLLPILLPELLFPPCPIINSFNSSTRFLPLILGRFIALSAPVNCNLLPPHRSKSLPCLCNCLPALILKDLQEVIPKLPFQHWSYALACARRQGCS